MPKILLVEDSATQAMQMRLLLESAGHEVNCCDDGMPAFDALADGMFQLVVTDLELPLMNGLELIKKMQVDFPQIPAILVTGQGSERLAAEALRCGATAYVPKSLLDDMLLGTVEDVLGVLRTDRSYAELIDCTVENRLVFDLPNKPRLLLTAIDLTMQLAAGMELLSGVERFRFAVALQHAAFNAMFRGNLELTHTQWKQTAAEDMDLDQLPALAKERLAVAPYRDRKIHFDVRIMKDFVRVVIRDQGRGFNTQLLGSDSAEDVANGEHGRGLILMRKFVDKVTFNDVGNEVTLVKHCHR